MSTDTAPPQKTCFVVMGFGEKTDFQTQRTLDLDKSYRIIIKRAVEAAGLRCVRADDVVHSGVIDKPMYELLLSADIVVADLSTSNANAIYELGVRHALRPNTTIVIAESQFKFPFDLSHLVIRPYEHLGKGIDAEEAERMRDELCRAITALANETEPDSPVYTFLHDLRPPTLAVSQRAVAQKVAEVLDTAEVATSEALRQAARKARSESNWVLAQARLSQLRDRQPRDPYVLQQLALATYKSKLPSPTQALLDALEVLKPLDPPNGSDPETLGLWGAIHKRLWELEADRGRLDEAIRAYERGFYLRSDSYTGINYAYLLNVRGSISDRANAITDYVTAQRVRRRVIESCERALEAGIKDDEGEVDRDETFWATATLVEAYVGVGDEEKGRALVEGADSLRPAAWMLSTLNEQLEKLRPMLKAQRLLAGA